MSDIDVLPLGKLTYEQGTRRILAKAGSCVFPTEATMKTTRLKAVEDVDASRDVLEWSDIGPIISGNDEDIESQCPICGTVLMRGVATGSLRGFYLRCKCGRISLSG